jgi:hypothetical protein
MKVLLKIFASFLLLVNGVGALYGNYHLIFFPDGSSLGMTTALLEHSPFTDFFIPGIILLVSNGIISFVALYALIRNVKTYPLLLASEGAILFGWIVIQIMMLRQVAALHIIYWLIGLLLIVSGLLLKRAR